MKTKTLTWMLCVFLTIPSVNAFQWMRSVEDAQKLAIATNKLILVDFWASWCGPCKRMDQESWSTSEVQELMKHYVPVKLDLDVERANSSRLGVRSIPYLFILDPLGNVIHKHLGYMDKHQVKQFLKTYALNITFLQEAYLQAFQEMNLTNLTNLAEKSLDYSLYLVPSVRRSFLKVVPIYVKKAKNLKAELKTNDVVIQQRLTLIEGYRYVIQGLYKKSLKKINQISYEDLVNDNKSLYQFLQYCSYAKLEQKEPAKLWFDKLKNRDDFVTYFKRSRKL